MTAMGEKGYNGQGTTREEGLFVGVYEAKYLTYTQCSGGNIVEEARKYISKLNIEK